MALSAVGGLNGYWGQLGSEPLRNYCDTGIEYVTLSFVNVAPENDPSGYPGTNFAGHCWAGTYKNEDGVQSKLLSECHVIKQDISYCQSKGVKVLLSIGGVYNADYSNYEVTTAENGVAFADFLYNAFGPYHSSWTGPRPFDNGDEPNAVDGFDFDIEEYFDNKPYIAMIERFRELDSDLVITAAPQCPTNDPYFQLKELIQKASLDALFVQFYNNPGCDAIDDPDITWDNFNYDEWENVLAQSEKSKNAKLYVGLPAASDAAGSGYIGPDELKELVCKLKDKPHFGGISLWDLTRGAANVIEGKDFTQHALDALKYGCGSSSSSTTSTRSSTTSTSTRSTTTATTTSSLSTTTSASTSVSSTSSTSSIESSSSSTSSETSSDSATSTSATSSESSSSSDVTTSPTIISSTSTFGGWNSTFTRSSSSSQSTLSETSLTETSGTGSQSPTVTGDVTSTGFGTTIYTTSTVYTTTCITFTTCPPYVDDCTDGGYVITKTIPLYTTVCPVSATTTAHESKPTTEGDKTKTIYTTKIYTITSCPASVPDCPVGSVTTEVSSWTTTVVRVTETFTAKIHKPTGGVPSDDDDEEDCGENCVVIPVIPVEEKTTTKHLTSTIYRTVVKPPATLETSTKPAVFTPQPHPTGGKEHQPSGVAVPTGGPTASSCVGEECPPEETVPVTAGASTLAVGIMGLFAMVAFAL